VEYSRPSVASPALPAAVSALRTALGAAAVITDADALDGTSHDTWPLSTKLARLGRHDHRADVVVRPVDPADIPTVVTIAAEHGLPVTPRGLGSSVTGQPLPVRGGIVLDLSGLPRRWEIDPVDMTVAVTAAVNGGDLEDDLAAQGWTLGHSPQSLYRSSVGGWLATLATGQFSSRYGGIEDLVVEYTVVLATGERVRLSGVPRAAMGPDLRRVFLGSEGTLGIVTDVVLKIFPVPEAELLQAFAVPTVSAGLEILRAQAAAGLRPFLLRLYDADEARHTVPGAGGPVLFAGSRGLAAVAEAESVALHDLARLQGAAPLGPAPVELWMARRFDFSAVENRLATPGGFAETIEIAHSWRHIGRTYEEMKAGLAPLADEVLVHFSHVYDQGTSMYVILFGQADDDAAAVQRLQDIWATAMRVGLDTGAVLSHHHGGGLARSPYARAALGDAHLVLRRIKDALDPGHLLNPGKLGL
jgi:alkyldihydroxyacetonephosphate synthase